MTGMITVAGSGTYIAIDWGTTNRRAYLMGGDGSVLDTLRDDHGILSMEAGDYAREIGSFRDRWAVEPVLIAGMAGSSRGWVEAPYVECPANADLLASAIIPAPLTGVWMVPGVARKSDARCDVMRGEEVQILGALAAGLAPADALFCQPGTHNKWIHVEAGCISDFSTVMTGELFSLLRSHGILAGMLDGRVADTAAFRAGVQRGAASPVLGAALFEVRASVLLGRLAGEDAAAFASGVLIGNDIMAAGDLLGRTVHMLGAGELGELYSAAIGLLGGKVAAIDGHVAFAAGIQILWERTI